MIYFAETSDPKIKIVAQGDTKEKATSNAKQTIKNEFPGVELTALYGPYIIGTENIRDSNRQHPRFRNQIK